MILKTKYAGEREMRLFESSSLIPSPGRVMWPTASANQPAITIAAVAAAVRLISESIGGFVARVYEGDGSERQPVMSAPQSQLLQHPNPDTTSFDFYSDLASSFELYEHGIVLKGKAEGRVVALSVVPPDWVNIQSDPKTGQKRILVWINGRETDITRDAIHIRSWSPNGAEGVSTTALHAQTLQTAGQYEIFRGAYYQNGAAPPVVLSHPGNPSIEQRHEILDSWIARHGDARNAHKPGLVWGGMEVTTMPTSMRDAQGPEVAIQIVQDVARMFRIYPPDLLHTTLAGGGSGHGDIWSDLFARFTLFPRMRRIERALSEDLDLFPQRRRYMRFDASDFTRANIDTLASVAHQLVQVGVLTANEGRAMMGLPKHPDGDELQATPVGGAPNESDTPALTVGEE